jgi:hypothetical protein
MFKNAIRDRDTGSAHASKESMQARCSGAFNKSVSTPPLVVAADAGRRQTPI